MPGEKRLAGRGISYCATCDGAFYKKKVTAVIGGGDVAVEDAIFLAGLCEKVYLIHRRDSLRAAKSLQEKLFTLPNVELVWNAAVEEITGEAFVTGVQLLDTQTKEERFVAADGIFIAVGIQPVSESFQEPCKNGRGRLYLCGRGLLHERAGHFCSRGRADEKAASDRDGGCRRGKCGQLCAGIFPDTVKKQRPKGKLLVAGAAKDALAV